MRKISYLLLLAIMATGCAGTIHDAAFNGDKEKVDQFLSKGVPVNLQDKSGATPLIKALKNHKYDVAKLLIEKGADMNVLDPQTGLPAIVFAANYKELDIIQAFITNGANVNLAHKDGFTALADAAYYGRIKLAEMLLEHGANPNAMITKDGQYVTVRQNAMAQGHTDMVALLDQYGAKSIMLFSGLDKVQKPYEKVADFTQTVQAGNKRSRTGQKPASGFKVSLNLAFKIIKTQFEGKALFKGADALVLVSRKGTYGTPVERPAMKKDQHKMGQGFDTPRIVTVHAIAIRFK